MKIDTLGSLVDLRPLYEALAEYKDQGDLYDAPTRAFLYRKIFATTRDMMKATAHVEAAMKRCADEQIVKSFDAPAADQIAGSGASEEEIAAVFDKGRPIADRLRDLAARPSATRSTRTSDAGPRSSTCPGPSTTSRTCLGIEKGRER